MKPLLPIVVTILALTANALPKNIEDVKELPQSKEPVVEAEESDIQARVERCTTCSPKLSLKSPKDVLAAIQQLPGAEVHTQQSFESCTSEKGCAGLKVKDGKVIQRFGNDDAFRAAAAQDTGNEFTFHAAGSLGNLLEGGLAGEGGPFWWMNQNSPFKGAGANGAGNFEKFEKSSSSTFSTSGAGGAAGFDLNGNPFLNGDFSKQFAGAGFAAGAAEKPGGFQSSSFESSSFSTSSKGGEVDLSKNQFLNGGKAGGFAAQGGVGFGANGAGANQFGQTGFGAQNSYSQSQFNKFGSNGYSGSSPSPFTASSGGSNVNLIQNSQKGNEFDFESQQSQTNVDEAFQSTGNVNAHEHTGGDLQQTCSGQGYVCVPKSQCNNGVVNTNGANVLAANTQKQYCNVRSEICCRIEVSSLAGAGSLQGSLGVGSAQFSGSGSQGSGLFVSNTNTQGFQGQSASGFNAAGQSGQSGNGFNAVGQSGNGFNAVGQSGQSGFNAAGQSTSFNAAGQSTYNQQGQSGYNGQTNFNQAGQAGQAGFGASSSSFNANKAFGQGFGGQASFGADSGLNRGVLESSSSSFESRSKFGGAGGSTVAPVNKYGSGFNNEVFKSTSQSNFIETDSFSAGSETAGVYRPGQTGLKPGIPYLPPVDSSTAASNTISSTAFVTTPRPFTTPRQTPRPRPTTSAPGYLPPVQGESSNTKETRLPNPNYNEGSIILDETRTTFRPPTQPGPNDIPSGCAAALKCTPIEFCTAEGVISNTSVILTRDQDAYRVPLTDCKDLASGRVGKCCRDPLYTDPWPTNQLGKWVPGVFGGNDGQYVPDSRGSSSNNPRPSQVTARPPISPITGSVILNNFITPKPTIPSQGPNQITPGFPSSTPSGFSKGQFDVRGQGSYSQTGQGQFGVGGIGQTSQGGQFGQGSQFTQSTSSSFGQTTRGQGQIIGQGQGQLINQGVGQTVTQGQGSFGQGGRGQYEIQGQAGQNQYTQTQNFAQGQGQSVSQGQGIGITRGQGQSVSQGVGQTVSQGVGQTVTQGQGIGIIRGSGQSVTGGFGVQGQGQSVSQGAGFGVTQGQGIGITRGQGQFVSQGQGQTVTQGQGIGVTRGQGQIGITGSGQRVSQGVGFGVTTGQGLDVTRGQGQFVSQGQGQLVSQGQGQLVSQGQGQLVNQGQGQAGQPGFGIGFGVGQGQGQSVSQGVGFGVTQGQGFGISQGQGQGVRQGGGFEISAGQGAGFGQGLGFGVNQGLGFGVIRGQGQALIQGQGQKLTQEVGSGEIRGQGFKVTQGQGFGVENEYSESVQRVFLSAYNGGGQCGLLNPQKPYGNRNDLEVDFAEIPWQAMVLLQTNRSLLCGGVITRPDVVVTSAACVDGLDAKNVLIKGGEYKLGIDDEPLPFQIVQVKTIIRHPFYRRGSLKYDAAILVLAEDLRFAKNIYPICLPGARDTLDAFYNGAGECIVTGWGKTVLQAHLKGAIMNGLNVSLINPGECEAKLQQDYPHLLDQYDEESCVCGQPTNPLNNICKVDIGSALACTTGDGRFVFRGIYSWDSGCQVGNQIAGFYKFDLEWYQWAIGLIESARFAKYGVGSKIKQSFTSELNSGVGIKGGLTGIKGISGIKGVGINRGESQFGQFSQFGASGSTPGGFGTNFGANSAGFGQEIKGPLTNSFSASYTEKKVFQSEPKYVTYTTKPEIVTFTTKPEYFTYTTKPKLVTYTTKPEIVTYTTKPEIVTFTTKPEIVTYTTKPKIVTYTTKPQIIRYETSGSGTNPQYVAPGVTFNPSFQQLVGHKHNGHCKCLENGRK